MVLGIIQQCLDSWLCEAPGASIERLFLTPDNGLGIGVHVKIVFQLLPWEGVQLLDTCDGCILESIVCSMLVESCVDLACAKNDTFNLLRVADRLAVLGVGDNPFELRVASKFFNW